MKIGFFLLALMPTVSLAETPVLGSENVLIQNVISAVGPSWNTAGNFKAVLVREGEYAALYIYRGPYDETPWLYAPHAAITGDYWATIPWLEFDEGGTLLLHSENRAHGRNKWETTLSIIRKNDRFIVSSYSFDTYDSLNPDNYTDCNIDMLTRTLTINDRVVTPFPLPAEIKADSGTGAFESACYVDYGN